MSKLLPTGVKVYEQHFKDGVLQFGKEAGEMVFSKIKEKGDKAHLLSISDMNFSSDELRKIHQSINPTFNISRGGFGGKRK
jgi:hypothetical protein